MSQITSPQEPSRAARAILQQAIAARVFPAAVAEVGDRHGVLWREAFGALTFDPDAPHATDDTVFDLASLTKPIATTSLVMRLIAQQSIGLHDLVSAHLPEWSGGDREHVSLQDLLEHASGLPARLLDAPPASLREFVHDICRLPLEYPPRTRAVYSDLGFILLGALAEQRGHESLSGQFSSMLDEVASRAGDIGLLGYDVPPVRLATTAPTVPLTDDLRRGRVLRGEVHDRYAAALPRGAGHAGLFGTASAVGAFARGVLRGATGDARMPSPFSPSLLLTAIRRSSVPGSSRALGWDTMLPTSSCGSQLSPAAFGHVGFTGTSLWIDPVLERYFVLLTNRVCGGGTIEAMRDVRRAFHDVVAAL